MVSAVRWTAEIERLGLLFEAHLLSVGGVGEARGGLVQWLVWFRRSLEAAEEKGPSASVCFGGSFRDGFGERQVCGFESGEFGGFVEYVEQVDVDLW